MTRRKGPAARLTRFDEKDPIRIPVSRSRGLKTRLYVDLEEVCQIVDSVAGLEATAVLEEIRRLRTLELLNED